MRHPEYFGKVVALSGRYDLSFLAGMYEDLLSGYYHDTVYHHISSHYASQMQEGEQHDKIRNLDITFACGNEDVFLENNRGFSKSLWNKGIWHAFLEWDGLAYRVKF